MKALRATLLAAVLCLSGGAALAQGMPTDPQIAHIAYTAGQIDIKAAKQALRKSHNPEVRTFARDMVRDHSAVNRKALALLKRLHVKPQDNATSRSLASAAMAKYSELGRLRGAAFDEAYAANELAYHKTVNGALRDTLIPSAQNPQLKSLLETGLKIFEAHQEHAQMLADKTM